MYMCKVQILLKFFRDLKGRGIQGGVQVRAPYPSFCLSPPFSTYKET